MLCSAWTKTPLHRQWSWPNGNSESHHQKPLESITAFEQGLLMSRYAIHGNVVIPCATSSCWSHARVVRCCDDLDRYSCSTQENNILRKIRTCWWLNSNSPWEQNCQFVPSLSRQAYLVASWQNIDAVIDTVCNSDISPLPHQRVCSSVVLWPRLLW